MSDSRLEKFIYAICSMDVSDLPVPLSRIEKLWNCLITGETPDFEPLSRNEKYLMAMLDRYDISNLPAPMSRGEKLLYKIAVGETDLSDVPDYLSRYEELLKYLIENGGISGGDFEYVLHTINQSLYTLYTTAEKPVKKAVIHGDTLVNTLQESSSLDVTPMGESIDAQQASVTGTANGVIQKATIKGQTKLLDEIGNECDYPNSPKVMMGMWIDTNNGQENASFTSFNTTFLKCPTTGFIVKGNNKYKRIIFYDKDKTYLGGKFASVANNNPVTISSSDIPANTVYMRFSASINADSISYTPDTKLLIEDANGNNLYVTHLESVKMPVLTTTGKNLISNDVYPTLEEIPYNHGGIQTALKLQLSPNTSYKFSMIKTRKRIDEFDGYNYIVNSDKVGKMTYRASTPVGTQSVVRVTTNTDGVILIAKYGFNFWEWGDCIVSLDDGTNDFVDYEPFKSNILLTPSDLELRKVEDVEDELDCSTGEVTVRIGEIVLDGSESWAIHTNSTNTMRFQNDVIPIPTQPDANIPANILCDKFKVVPNKDWRNDEEQIEIGMGVTKKYELNIRISKTKLNGETAEAFKEYLRTNPVTVQYILKTPTTKTVPLTIQDQDGNAVSHLQAFNETTHISTSSTGLTPHVVIPATVSYPSIIKPSTLYTVKLKRSVTSGTLTINVGGTEQAVTSDCFTITTPSTLTSQEVIFSGKGNVISEVTVVEGDQTAKEYGYFEGMMSVKMPVLTTTGKNLFDGKNMSFGYYRADGVIDDYNHENSLSDYIKVEPSSSYAYKCFVEDQTSLYGEFAFFDENKNFIEVLHAHHTSDTCIITPNNCYYLRPWNNQYINNGNSHPNAMLVKTTNLPSALIYEPYRSNTLTLAEPVTLRKVGDVEDELDCLTGEIVSNFSTYSFSDVDNWKTNTEANCQRFSLDISPSPIGSDYSNEVCIVSDKLPGVKWNQSWNTVNTITCSNGSIRVQLPLGTTIEQCKELMRGSKIVYRIKSLIKTVDLTVVDQDGQPTQLGTFENITHVSLEAENLIPTLEMEVATRISEELASASPLMDDISKEQQQLETTVDEQSNNVDATMIATTEIYEETL